MVYPALLPLMRTPRMPVVVWTDAPADLNGLVRFAEKRNLVSARVPSHFNWPLSLDFPKCQFIYESLLHLRNVAGHFLSGRSSRDPPIRQTIRVAQQRRQVKNYIFRKHLHPPGYVLRTCLFLFLGAFSKLRKATIIAMSVRPLACLRRHGTHRFPRDEFSWNLISVDSLFRKSAQKIQISLQSDKSDGCFTWRTIYIWNI